MGAMILNGECFWSPPALFILMGKVMVKEMALVAKVFQARGWGDVGKMLSLLFYVAIISFCVPLGCCSFFIILWSSPKASLLDG